MKGADFPGLTANRASGGKKRHASDHEEERTGAQAVRRIWRARRCAARAAAGRRDVRRH